MNFEDKIVIVTGSASGIGESCVTKLLSLNATVAGFDRQPSKIVAQKFIPYSVDVTDVDAVRAVVDKVEKDSGKIDGLINCAGVTSYAKPFYEMSVEEFETVISINLTGTFICSKYVSRKMMEKKNGKIVNISCVRSRIFGSNSADYSASKGGVVALTSAMAVDLAPLNIQVNSVAPGATLTAMTRDRLSSSTVIAMYEKSIPLGRIAKASDIAEVVLFLLSESANYVTGETIFVDGGYSISK
jgi:NAD(P)-dependent dehydrogenase (short-subunit alcohol dehydrogenase family)